MAGMDDGMDMYNTDDFELPNAGQTNDPISITHKGMLIELEVNGRKFEVVNPDYVRELQRLISSMDSRLRNHDRVLRMAEQRIAKQDRVISDLRSQLDGKIDRE